MARFFGVSFDFFNLFCELQIFSLPSLPSYLSHPTSIIFSTITLQVVSEKWSDDKVEITLQQDRFLSDGSLPNAEEASALWSIPLLFASSGTARIFGNA